MDVTKAATISRSTSFDSIDGNAWEVLETDTKESDRKISSMSPPPHEAIAFQDSESSSPNLTGRVKDDCRSVELFDLISTIYRESLDVRDFPRLSVEKFKSDIPCIQGIRNIFEKLPLASWVPILSSSSSVQEGYSENPKLFKILAHYLYSRNPSQNLALIQFMNEPLLNSLSPGPNRSSLLYSLGLLHLDANSSFFSRFMHFLSQNRSIESEETKPYQALVSWLRKGNFSLPIPQVPADAVSEFYDCDQLKIPQQDLSFLLVFDVFCAQNSDDKLKRLCKPHFRNLSDNLKLHCLNKLIQTLRFDLAACVIESISKPSTKLTKALKELDYSQVIKEAKKVLILDTPDNLVIKKALTNLFINEKQWPLVKDLFDIISDASFKESTYTHIKNKHLSNFLDTFPLKTLTDTEKVEVAECFIRNNEYLNASKVIRSITSTTTRKTLYIGLSIEGKNDIIELCVNEDHIAKEVMASNCAKNQQYTHAVEVLKTITPDNKRKEVYQHLVEESQFKLLLICAETDNLAKEVLATHLCLTEQFTQANNLIESISNFKSREAIYKKLIGLEQYDILFTLSMGLMNNDDKKVITTLFQSAKQNEHAMNVFIRLPNITKDSIVREALAKSITNRTDPTDETEVEITNLDLIEAYLDAEYYNEAFKLILNS
jgi:hypothetical protein